VIIAHTVKGKGVSFMENDYLWHSKPMVEADLTRAMSDLASPNGGH
jgi:transketolase